MSTTEQQHILAYGTSKAVHFAKAVDGTDTVQLTPITDASFEDSENKLMIFNNAAAAYGYKDQLCYAAAAQEVPQYVRGTTFNPLPLEVCCDLTVKPYMQEFEIA